MLTIASVVTFFCTHLLELDDDYDDDDEHNQASDIRQVPATGY